MNGPGADVFISYSHADREWVTHALLPALEGAGLQVIVDDRDFQIGTPSLINMERAVEKSLHTLLVLTPAWLQSEWTDFESLLAGLLDPAGRRLKLVVLMLEPCQPPLRIAMLGYTDLTDPAQRDVRMTELLRRLSR